MFPSPICPPAWKTYFFCVISPRPHPIGNADPLPKKKKKPAYVKTGKPPGRKPRESITETAAEGEGEGEQQEASLGGGGDPLETTAGQTAPVGAKEADGKASAALGEAKATTGNAHQQPKSSKARAATAESSGLTVATGGRDGGGSQEGGPAPASAVAKNKKPMSPGRKKKTAAAAAAEGETVSETIPDLSQEPARARAGTSTRVAAHNAAAAIAASANDKWGTTEVHEDVGAGAGAGAGAGGGREQESSEEEDVDELERRGTGPDAAVLRALRARFEKWREENTKRVEEVCVCVCGCVASMCVCVCLCVASMCVFLWCEWLSCVRLCPCYSATAARATHVCQEISCVRICVLCIA